MSFNFKSSKQFVNESLKSDILKKMMASGDAYTKGEIQAMANWDKSKGFALSEIDDSQFVTTEFMTSSNTAYFAANKLARQLWSHTAKRYNDIELMFIDKNTNKLIAKWGYATNDTQWLISAAPNVKIRAKKDLDSMDSALQAITDTCVVIAYNPGTLTTRGKIQQGKPKPASNVELSPINVAVDAKLVETGKITAQLQTELNNLLIPILGTDRQVTTRIDWDYKSHTYSSIQIRTNAFGSPKFELNFENGNFNYDFRAESPEQLGMLATAATAATAYIKDKMPDLANLTKLFSSVLKMESRLSAMKKLK